MTRACVIVLVAWLLGSCGSSGACTEIGCESDATVAISGGPITGPFDLVVQTDNSTFMARCADPGAPEVAMNDPEVECSATEIALFGDAATGHSVRVTIVPVEMDPLVEGAEVLLSVVDERTPNGEGCPPTCYSRSGQLILS
jgi:hypothetical protein